MTADGNWVGTLYDMSIIRMNMFTLTGTGCNIHPEGPGGGPGGRGSRGPGETEAPQGPGNGMLQPRPIHANEKTCNSNVYMRECRTGMPYSYIFNSPLEEAACLCSINYRTKV